MFPGGYIMGKDSFQMVAERQSVGRWVVRERETPAV